MVAPGWICSSCRTPVPTDAGSCMSCGASLPGSLGDPLSHDDQFGGCSGARLCGVLLALIALAACDGGRACCAPPPLASALRVTTITTGESVDPDGYTALAMRYHIGLDSLSHSIEVNDTIVMTLNPVTYWISLEDVQANCLVLDSNPRSVDIPEGDTASTTFEVRCAPTTAGIAYGGYHRADHRR